MCDTGYTVKEFVTDLRDLKSRGLDEVALLAEARDLASRLMLMKHNWLRSYMMAPPEPADHPFSRHKLHEESDHSLLVLVVTLGAGRHTAPHDHGTWALVAGLDGHETNRRWRLASDGGVEPDGEQAIDSATIVSISSGEIHSLHNETGAPSVTLQVYGSNPEFTPHRNFTPRRSP
jgi:predicted metal-dependent enzyme (double-stranded beta helix superfamily)